MEYESVLRSKTSPEYIRGNSMSHKSVFGAVAELIDNARDAGLSSTHTNSLLWIDEKRANHQHCLVLTDNGCGMDEERLHNMMSLGYTGSLAENEATFETEHGQKDNDDTDCDDTNHLDTEEVQNRTKIGRFGFGFKSGSMRIGDDAVVLTMTELTCSVGMYSTTFLKLIKVNEVLLPIVSFDKDDMSMVRNDHAEQSLELITKYSIIFKSLADIKEEFNDLRQQIKGRTGTRVIIYNLKKIDNAFELNFKNNAKDIVLLSTSSLDAPFLGSVDLDYRHSLREYCSILYSSSSMKIILRGKEVQLKNFREILNNPLERTHKNRPTGKCVELLIGMTDQTDYGLMLYHDERLITAYEKIGCQIKPGEGKGVMALADLSGILEPMHNKQDFNTIGEHYHAYNSAIKVITGHLNGYCKKNAIRAPSPIVQQTPRRRGKKTNRGGSLSTPSKGNKLVSISGAATSSKESCNMVTSGLLSENSTVLDDENIGCAIISKFNLTTQDALLVTSVLNRYDNCSSDEDDCLFNQTSEKIVTITNPVTEANGPSFNNNDENICIINDDESVILVDDEFDENSTAETSESKIHRKRHVINTTSDEEECSRQRQIKVEDTKSEIKTEVCIKNESDFNDTMSTHNLFPSSYNRGYGSTMNTIERLNKDLIHKMKELAKRTNELQNLRMNVLMVMSRTHPEFVKNVNASNLSDIDSAFEQKMMEMFPSSAQI